MSASLQVGTIWTRITCPTPELFRDLHAAFQRKDPKFEHQLRWLRKAHRTPRGSWEGMVKFVIQARNDPSAGIFSTGLLPKIVDYLNSKSISHFVVDKRPKLAVPTQVTSDFFVAQSIKLHDYQVEAANLAIQKQTGIIKCATGGGKTLIIAAILKALGPSFPAVVLCKNISLVEQTYEVFKKCEIGDVGRLNMYHSDAKAITCSTVQSWSKIEPLLPQTRALIVDEVHQFSSSLSVQKLNKFDQAVFRLGFSATPFKAQFCFRPSANAIVVYFADILKGHDIHNMRLTGSFGPLLTDVTTQQLTERSILAEATIHFYPIEGPKGLKTKDFSTAEELGIVQNKFFHDTVAELVNRIPEGRIMILVKRIAHGDALASLIPNCYWIKGKDDQETRDYVLSQLRQSAQKKVVAIVSSIGTIGVNVYVHHLINATGGKDASHTIQKLGRGLRKAPDKEKVEYHDFLFSINHHLLSHSDVRRNTLQKEGHPVVLEEPIIPASTYQFPNAPPLIEKGSTAPPAPSIT